MASFDNRLLALARLLDCYPDKIQTNDQAPTRFTHQGDVYRVYTEREANKAWDVALDDVIYTEILPQLPEQFQAFFDHAAWKAEARADGRNMLNTHNQIEYSADVEAVTYFIYQIKD